MRTTSFFEPLVGLPAIQHRGRLVGVRERANNLSASASPLKPSRGEFSPAIGTSGRRERECSDLKNTVADLTQKAESDAATIQMLMTQLSELKNESAAVAKQIQFTDQQPNSQSEAHESRILELETQLGKTEHQLTCQKMKFDGAVFFRQARRKFARNETAMKAVLEWEACKVSGKRAAAMAKGQLVGMYPKAVAAPLVTASPKQQQHSRSLSKRLTHLTHDTKDSHMNIANPEQFFLKKNGGETPLFTKVSITIHHCPQCSSHLFVPTVLVR
jgi:hypothetical protein